MQDVSVRALVVGVGNYTVPNLRLANPTEDARAIAETLERQNASVTLLLDPTRAQLRDALEAFSTPQVQQVRRARRVTGLHSLAHTAKQTAVSAR